MGFPQTSLVIPIVKPVTNLSYLFASSGILFDKFVLLVVSSSPKPRGRGRKGRGSSVQLKEGNAETPKR